MSFVHQKNRTTTILKSLFADCNTKMKTVHSGDSADLLKVSLGEVKAADKACLCCELHISVCSTTGKVVLRMAAGLIAKLKLRTSYRNPARRDFVKVKQTLYLRGELLVPLD